MNKDFDGWSTKKKNIDKCNRQTLFNEREIWWCSLGVNIGFEQNGVNELFERPVLILKKFNKDTLWVLPITRSAKIGPYYYQIRFLNFPSSIILSQIRLISSKRLLRRMKKINEKEFFEIVKMVKNFLPQGD